MLVTGKVSRLADADAGSGAKPLYFSGGGKRQIGANYGFPYHFKEVKVGEELTVLTMVEPTADEKECPFYFRECWRCDFFADTKK